jgi:hypothetical protein
MDFAHFLWLLLWSFVFISYLFIFFYILGDLFRDAALSGWWKAIWIVLLVVFPFGTALVYLIARGKGMTERSLAAAQAQQAAAADYIQSVAGAGQSPADQIASAKALLDSGSITQAEFNTLKAKALA